VQEESQEKLPPFYLYNLPAAKRRGRALTLSAPGVPPHHTAARAGGGNMGVGGRLVGITKAA